jgi:Icc-related predicted phosphoesterase
VKVLATSDFHGQLPHVPRCDLLLIGGDICPDHPIGKKQRYTLHDNGAESQFEWLDQTFRPWLIDLRERGIHVIAIAGNHDFVFEKMKTAVRELYLPWVYLEDSLVDFKGLHVYGTPWVPGLPRWAFYGSDNFLKARAESIPKCDILLSHGPPFGYCDFVAPQFGSKHVGDPWLEDGIKIAKPQAVVCGHIHERHGRERMMKLGVDVYNVSYVNEFYDPVHGPVRIPVTC